MHLKRRNFKAVDDMLEAEFLDSLRNADTISESQKEHYSAYLAEDDTMNRWVEAQFTDDLYKADLRLGIRPDMALLWCVKNEDPLEAAETIVVLEGWCLRHLTFIQGSPTTHPWACIRDPLLNEILRLLHVGHLESRHGVIPHREPMRLSLVPGRSFSGDHSLSLRGSKVGAAMEG